MKVILGHSNSVLSCHIDILVRNNLDKEIDIISNLDSHDETVLYKNNKLIINEYFSEMYSCNLSNNYILGVNSPTSKNKVYNYFLNNNQINYKLYINLIPKEIILPDIINLGHGITISYGVTIAPYTTINNFVSINRNSSIGHHCVLDDFVTINPGVNYFS